MKRPRPSALARVLFALPTSLAMSLPAMAQDQPADAPVKPAVGLPSDPIGYFIGLSVGQQLSGQGFRTGDFTANGLASGIADALAKKEPALSPEQMQAVVEKIQGIVEERQGEQAAERARAVAANMEKSTLYLQENAKKEGIKTLASGLQYKVLASGAGKSPTAEDTVRVHYTGTLIDGTKFDSSVDRGEPAEFSVGQVIPGWRQALQEMKTGDKWMLYIPPQLAYGERGAPGGQIGPNEALIFEVELLEIVK